MEPDRARRDSWALVALLLGIGVGLGFRDDVDLLAPLGRVYINLLLAGWLAGAESGARRDGRGG
ncbi:hypothetical protein [Mumia sp. ZJ430]|uniref:hypothetical protein n=1 Tax=Mumia sp. ZJ430 TaxID=2708083 RepID=UPI0014235BC2|nr:hypothetical protein [Mumia sp. ZJ430]